MKKLLRSSLFVLVLIGGAMSLVPNQNVGKVAHVPTNPMCPDSGCPGGK